MKKILSLGFILATAFVLVACQGNNAGGGNDVISVVSREEGSGTRTAFEELLDINTSEENRMTTDAIIRDGNGVVATEVMGNEASIGYVTFATLEANADNLTGLYVDGAAPKAENVLNGTYELARNFEMIFPQEDLTEIETAFIEFMKSVQGLEALESADGIVDFSDAEEFDMAQHQGLTGTLTLGGSTSTEGAVMAVVEEFQAMFPQVSISYNSVGSGAGIQGAQDGRFDIGFSSREVLDSEIVEGFETTTICSEGIVFIIHPDNDVTDLTVEQIRDIYLGNITSWDEFR